MIAQTPGGGVAAELAVAKQAYEEAVKQGKSGFDVQRASLFAKYTGAVEKLKVEFQNRGDLPNALLAEEELMAAKSLLTSDKAFPGVERLRPILLGELAKINGAADEHFQKTTEAYMKQLEEGKVALTKEGALRGASAVEEELKRLREQLSSSGEMEKPPAKPALGAKDPTARGGSRCNATRSRRSRMTGTMGRDTSPTRR